MIKKINWSLKWRDLVKEILDEQGGTSSVADIYFKILEKSKTDFLLYEKINEINYEAAVRRTLQNHPDFFEHRKDKDNRPIMGEWQLVQTEETRELPFRKQIKISDRQPKKNNKDLTWKNILREILQELGGEGSLDEIYKKVEERGIDNVEIRRRVNETNYESSIRYTLQVHPNTFTQNIHRSGIWRLIKPMESEVSDAKNVKTKEKQIISTEIEIIKKEIRKTQFYSEKSEEFEKAIADALAYLGFETEHLGKAGKTDVKATASIGLNRYNVIIDAKTSKHGKILESQIHWAAINDHKKAEEADYVIIIGPDFAGGNLVRRAREYEIILMNSEQLIRVLNAYEEFPFSLMDFKDNILDEEKSLDERISRIETLSRTQLENWKAIFHIYGNLLEIQKKDPDKSLSIDAIFYGIKENKYNKLLIEKGIRLLSSEFLNLVEKREERFIINSPPKTIRDIFQKFNALALGTCENHELEIKYREPKLDEVKPIQIPKQLNLTDLKKIEIFLPPAKESIIPYWKKYYLIPVYGKNRLFFPEYQKPFILSTDEGEIETYVTSKEGKKPIKDPKKAGQYIMKGLRNWFRKHKNLEPGDILIITEVIPKIRYNLEIKKRK